MLLDSLNYPLVKLSFSDQSSVLYAMEMNQIMSFVSELNSNLVRQRKHIGLTLQEDFQPLALLLQSHQMPRNLAIRGRTMSQAIAKDYYTNLVEGFYRNLHDSLLSLSQLHKVMANFFPGYPNPKFHLKFFYLIITQLIKAANGLKDEDSYTQARNKKTKHVYDSVFGQLHSKASGPKPGDSMKSLPSEGDNPLNSADDKTWDGLLVTASNIEHYLKLLNLLLQEDAFRIELSQTLFDREESKSKIQTLRELVSVLQTLNMSGFEVMVYHSTLLLRTVYTIVSNQREIKIEDELNIHRFFWTRIIDLELREVPASEQQYLQNQLRLSGILECLTELFQVDRSNKTANSTSELFLNSALGRIVLARLHSHPDSGVQFNASSLLLKSLKATAAKKRLLPEQSFYLNYTVVLLRHYKLTISSCPRDQQKLSSEVIHMLVSENPLALNTITRLIPKHTLRRISTSLNDKDITKWKAQEWFNTAELLKKEFEELDADSAVPSRSLLGHLSDYLCKFDSQWKKIPRDCLHRVLDNVILHQPSHLRDINQVVQMRHNFEEFELDYPRHLGKILVGRYFLHDLYDDNEITPSLKLEIQHPDQFYQELKSFYINQKDVKVKTETLKAMALVYSKYSLPKMDLMPYFINEYAASDDAVLQYNLLQYFGALVSCQEIYTRFHNLNEFAKHEGYQLVTKMIFKNLVEASGDHAELPSTCPNFTPAPIPRVATTKAQLKINSILLSLYLLGNVEYFDDKTTGHTIQSVHRFPDKRSTKHMSDDTTLALILQLLLHKDELVVKTTIQLVTEVFSGQSLIRKVAEVNTFWERIIWAGLRPGMAFRAAGLFCTVISVMKEDASLFEKELKDLQRLFPEHVIEWFSKKSPEECTFVFEFEERIDAEMYWTQPMYDELKNTMNLLFTLDLQNLDEYITGKKKVFPKPRSPPIRVEAYYETPKGLLAVDGLFLSSLAEDDKNYDFRDTQVIKDALLGKCLSLLRAKAESKEFATYDSTVVSEIKTLAKVCLKLAQVKRIRKVEDFAQLLEFAVLLVDHWNKNGTRISVRGLNLYSNFCLAMIYLLRIASIHIECKYHSEATVKKCFDLIGLILKKLVRRYNIDSKKTTLLDFEVFSAVLRLEHRIISLNTPDVIEGYQEMIQDTNQDFDFHFVHGLRIIRDNLVLLTKTAPRPADPKPETAESSLSEPKQNGAPKRDARARQLASKPEEKRAYLPGSIQSALDDALAKDLVEYEHVSRQSNYLLLSSSLSSYLASDDSTLRLSLEKSILLFNYYLLDTLKKLSEYPRILSGFIKNGVAYSALDILLSAYLLPDSCKDPKLKPYLLQYTSIIRKILSAGNETTIMHYGAENCAVELSLRGQGAESFGKKLEELQEEERLLLTEFFRVIRKDFHMKFIEASIKGYGPFLTEAGVLRNSEEFIAWLLDQKEVRKPNFIWNVQYAEELAQVINLQVTSILQTRKANYSYHFDEFKSQVLAKYTKVGDLFLETFIEDDQFVLAEPDRIIKQVGAGHPARHRGRRLGFGAGRLLRQRPRTGAPQEPAHRAQENRPQLFHPLHHALRHSAAQERQRPDPAYQEARPAAAPAHRAERVHGRPALTSR